MTKVERIKMKSKPLIVITTTPKEEEGDIKLIAAISSIFCNVSEALAFL
jgi:hypothetical protein